MQLEHQIVPVVAISAADRQDMLDLMVRHYENVCPQAFAADLTEKQWVILIRDPSDHALCGFSTQMLIDLVVEGRPIKALFSGDTIVDQQHWGQQALLQASGQLAASIIERHPASDLFWFLLSQGYKTYRFLPVFFREFYPCYDVPIPPNFQVVLDALAAWKYPGRYDREAGVVRTASDQYHLRRGVAEVTAERLRDPHVRYFLKRNSGHAAGDELCCLAPLTWANLTPAAHRFLRSS